MVATFTEKAAKELVTRITNELLKIGLTLVDSLLERCEKLN